MHPDSAPLWRFRNLLSIFALLQICLLPPLWAAGPIDASTYPREFRNSAGTVKVHHPVISDWRNFKSLLGRVPLEITGAAGDSWIGSLSFEVDTTVHFEDRIVSLHNPRPSRWDFDGGEPPGEIIDLARAAIQSGSDKVALDYLLRALPDDFRIPSAAKAPPQLNSSPPRIVISNRPMRLLLIDGPPSMAPIESTGLEYVINTDWDIFHHKASKNWYLLSDQSWQSNNMLSSGDWFPTLELPGDFQTLQYNSYWPQVAEAMPPRPSEKPSVPFTISYEPTELILVDGDTQLEEIPGTGLRYVKNTDSDLFVFAERYYLLVSGRWFVTKNLNRQWSAVKQLPTAFRNIPADHDKSYVLASVPGTQMARLALIEAAIPRISVFSLGAGDGLTVPYAGEPSFIEIQGTSLRRAENTPFQVILHNNFYYLCHEGAWYKSTRAPGPWQLATEVPEEIYNIPSTDPAYNVTFVRLDSFDDSSQQAAYSQTSGYHRVYSNGYSLVYGTGWHYPGHIHHNPYGYNSYWRYPYSYGYGAWYNPVYGRYGYRGGYGYYPYYSYNYSATYEVNKPDKDWKWDLDGNKRQVHDYGARNYIGSGKYVMPDGKVYRGENQSGTQTKNEYTAAKRGKGDLYSGSDGGVYRRSEAGWQRYEDGRWREVSGDDQASLERQYQARQAGYKNYDEYLRQKSG
jgi:hypothetical protein